MVRNRDKGNNPKAPDLESDALLEIEDQLYEFDVAAWTKSLSGRASSGASASSANATRMQFGNGSTRAAGRMDKTSPIVS